MQIIHKLEINNYVGDIILNDCSDTVQNGGLKYMKKHLKDLMKQEEFHDVLKQSYDVVISPSKYFSILI